MPIFEFDDEINDKEFRRLQAQLSDKIMRIEYKKLCEEFDHKTSALSKIDQQITRLSNHNTILRKVRDLCETVVETLPLPEPLITTETDNTASVTWKLSDTRIFTVTIGAGNICWYLQNNDYITSGSLVDISEIPLKIKTLEQNSQE